jgi:3-hydroxybutyryl-CoA dehydrogenase
MTPPFTPDTVVGVLGAGAMGGGIAQVAARAGHRVVLVDTSREQLERAHAAFAQALARDVEKGRLDAAAAKAVGARVDHVERGAEAPMDMFETCGIVIEAIVERLDIKHSAFAALERAVAPGCALATNTSSLSVSSIGSACERPERVLGVHFFNPAPVMPLVEIVPGVATSDAVVRDVRALVDGWKKTTVIAADTPGFIVNRIARPFYGEAWRIVEEGSADAATVDWAMRDLGGFRMGPFELMDFIGHDVNFAVTRSVYEATFHEPRYRPSLSQQRLVEAGRLGRKAGRGVYDYRDGAARPAPNADRASGEAILRRILAMLVNEAADAVHWRIASAADIDLAMTRGVNYPKGLLAWGDELGAATVLAQLEALHAEYGEDRYRASPLVRRAARDGGRLGA